MLFVSVPYLTSRLGIDPVIAKTYVDRAVPADNLYWHKRLLYLQYTPGYLFMPLFSHLMLQTGVTVEALIAEEQLALQEQVLHLAAQQENSDWDWTYFFTQLVQVLDASGIEYAKITALQQQIEAGSPPYTALKRGDAYLYSLLRFDFDEQQWQAIIKAWYALTGVFLLFDDVEDAWHDFDAGNKENAIIESLSSQQGVEGLITWMLTNNEYLTHLSEPIGAYQLRTITQNKTVEVIRKIGAHMV